MLVGYALHWHPAEITVFAVLKRSSRLPTTVRDYTLGFGSFALVSLFRSAFISKEHPANVFFTVEKVAALKKMTWVRKAHQCVREQRKAGQREASLWEGAMSMYKNGFEATIS